MNRLLAGGDQGITNPIFGGAYQTLLGQTDGGSGFISLILPKFIGLLFVFGALAFFFMFIWGAITWILSGGDKAHVENARGRITNAIVGFVLLIGSFAIVKLIEAFFGIDILLIDIGPLIIQ
ncbi:MAG: hypothetical protein ACD_19C00014G0016 [uncultured bacterium]|nr:MAG: hypothetical protein ACD_19C00014G0016 [uncultured bacterium]